MKVLIFLFFQIIVLNIFGQSSFVQLHQLTWGWKVNATTSELGISNQYTCLFLEQQFKNKELTMGYYDKKGVLLKKDFSIVNGYSNVYSNNYKNLKNEKIIIQGTGFKNSKFTDFTILYDNKSNLIWEKSGDSNIKHFTIVDDSLLIGNVDSISNNQFYGSLIIGLNLYSGSTKWEVHNYQLLGLSSHYRDSIEIQDIEIINDTVRIILKEINSAQYSIVSVSSSGKILRQTTGILNASKIFFVQNYLASNTITGTYPKSRFKLEIYEMNTLKSIFSYLDSSVVLDGSEISDMQLSDNGNFYLLINRKSIEDTNNKKDTFLSEVHILNNTGAVSKKIRYTAKNRSLNLNSLSLINSTEMFLSGNLFWTDAELSWGVIIKTDSFGFVSDSILISKLVSKPTSISEKIIGSSFSVYPNPTSSTLTISTQNTNQQSYSLLDLKGRQVLSGYFSNKTQLNVSDLKTGMYFLRIQNSENGLVETRKVIVGR